MKYRLLGNSGLRVSEAALGTMTFGEEWGWGSVKDEARQVYDAFREAGGNFIDTANSYTKGTSESFLGEFMKDHRQSMVLATKYSSAARGTDPNAAGNHRKNMMQAVEASLRRLQTDYIDLYWVHIWDQMTPVEEVMRGLDDLVRQGKVLYVGISDAPAWWIAQANTLAQLRGWSPFTGLQVEYSLIERTVERELVPMAKALKLGFTAWSPLAGGMLTGKYHGHSSPEQARMNGEMMKDFMPEQQRTGRIVAAVKAVSVQTGHGMASLPPGSGHPDPWRAKAFSAAGQSCELQPRALSGTSKCTRRGEPNRSRIPLSLLCQRACPRECVRRHARPDHGLTAGWCSGPR